MEDNMISLREITTRNYSECISLEVNESQKNYVYSNLESLKKWENSKINLVPLAIYINETIIGFLMYKVNWKYDCYFLWSFMVDKKYQGFGFGKKALANLVSKLENDNKCSRITTTVVEGNEVVLSMYIKAGFRTLGEMQEGEIDLERIID